jgi:hypothetical protein
MMVKRDITIPTTSPWLTVGALLSGVGGALYLLKAWPFAMDALRVVGFMSFLDTPQVLQVASAAVIGALGVIGIGAALQSRSQPRQAIAGAALAGMVGLLLDTSGALAPPRLIPGLLLLAAAAMIYSLRDTPDGRTVTTFTYMLAQVVFGVALLAHGVLALYFVPFGLGVPPQGMAMLYIIWGGMLALAWRLRREYPWLTLAIPPITFLLIYRLLLLAERLFAWTA